MSSLGLSLLLLVALAVAVALLYNLRQSWPRLRWPGRPRGQADAAAAEPAADSVVALRGEPRLGATEAAPDRAAATPASHHPAEVPDARSAPLDQGDEDAHVEDAQAEAGGAVAAATPTLAARQLSEIFDCIVELPLPSASPGEPLLALAQRLRRVGAKPVNVEGLPVGAAPEEWGALEPARRYQALRVGILMANRHGALNAMEFSEFVAGVQAIAEPLAVLADTPDMAAVLARARDLDATCAQLDAQVGVNVEAPEALGPAQLAALAATMSVVERGSNRYARMGVQGDVVFSVALADVPNRLTFLLDVPRSAPASDAWRKMLEAANACAQRVGGRLVDDGGRPLLEPALAQIGRQLVQRYESLEAIGLPAGSALALRVFN